MGSPPKLERIRKSLADRNFSRVQIDRITCPVGIEIGSDTPEEIAVSVAAQILQRRRSGNEHEETDHLYSQRRDHHDEVAPTSSHWITFANIALSQALNKAVKRRLRGLLSDSWRVR